MRMQALALARQLVLQLGQQLGGQVRDTLANSSLTEAEIEQINRATRNLNSAGFDPWGLDPDTVKRAISTSLWLYRHYFRVEVKGIEKIPIGRVLLIANHGGQVPVDAFVIGLSAILEGEPPRIVRGMVERWAPTVPFVSSFFTRLGQMVGDHRNCRALLDHDECVLAFPEGVGGSGKTIGKKYQLQKFGTGFVRLALESKAPIVPVAVIGAEEVYPSIYDFKWLARLLRAPYFPITPLFPILGPVGALPLPCKITIRYGNPIYLEGDPDAPDSEIERKIDGVREAIQRELDLGLEIRGDRIFTGSAISEEERAQMSSGGPLG